MDKNFITGQILVLVNPSLQSLIFCNTLFLNTMYNYLIHMHVFFAESGKMLQAEDSRHCCKWTENIPHRGDLFLTIVFKWFTCIVHSKQLVIIELLIMLDLVISNGKIKDLICNTCKYKSILILSVYFLWLKGIKLSIKAKFEWDNTNTHVSQLHVTRNSMKWKFNMKS